jgi:penicillin G amidase
VMARALAFVLVECIEADPAFDPRRLRNREEAVWRLVTERPLHLLDPASESWDGFLLAAADAVVEEAQAAGPGDLSQRVWSEWNVTAYRHPLSAQVPALARWLDMPPASLPGDAYTVRVHWRSIAASMRLVVSPGREEEGILQMPTGQSGHPRSPFYGNSHPAWVEGTPQPLLPGPPVHRLTLAPG